MSICNYWENNYNANVFNYFKQQQKKHKWHLKSETTFITKINFLLVQDLSSVVSKRLALTINAHKTSAIFSV